MPARVQRASRRERRDNEGFSSVQSINRVGTDARNAGILQLNSRVEPDEVPINGHKVRTMNRILRARIIISEAHLQEVRHVNLLKMRQAESS